MDERANEEMAIGFQAQMDYIDRQLGDLKVEQAKFEAAYQRDIYTLDEFEVKMKNIKARAQTLEVSRGKVAAKLAESHSLEEKKQVVLRALTKIREQVEQAKAEKRQPSEIPIELKRRILNTLVEVIWVNSVEKSFTIEGEISGVYAFGDEESQGEIIPDTGEEKGDFGFSSAR
jgi:hypothetical protein